MILVIIDLLARIIAGEVGPSCGIEGRLAVAHIFANRERAGLVDGWYGNREPSYVDEIVARNFQYLEDPTSGALYLFNANDLRQAAVQRIVSGRAQTWQGCGLYAYR